MDAVMVEIANRDAGFAALSADDSCSFARLTLFPGKTWRDVPGRKRRAAIRGALERAEPDVVCVNGWSLGGAIASIQWAQRNDRGIVLFSDSNRFDRSRSKVLEFVKQRLVFLADAGMAGGTSSREYLKDLGMRPDKILVGYDVVDNVHFSVSDAGESELSRPAAAPRGPYFLAAGRFESKKNHLRLLEAFARYREAFGPAAWPLVLLGDGALRQELEAARARLDLGDSLVLPGFVQYEELPRWYQCAACFVHPSTTEQWGLVVNEAMASGLPVLVSERCGCAPDLVESGKNGFLFDPYDVDALAGLMQHVAAPECDRAAMSAASLEIIGRWSPETFAASLAVAVEAALEGGGRRAGLLDGMVLRALSHR